MRIESEEEYFQLKMLIDDKIMYDEDKIKILLNRIQIAIAKYSGVENENLNNLIRRIKNAHIVWIWI